jgi:hypothetical protein
LRKAADCVEKLITPEGVRLPPLTLTEMLRHMARLRFLTEQIRSIEKAHVMRLADVWRHRLGALVEDIVLVKMWYGSGRVSASDRCEQAQRKCEREPFRKPARHHHLSNPS